MSKKTIAIMTSDERMARFLSLELQTLGYDTLTLRKGERADNASLMIVDVDTAGELKQAYRIPLLFISARQDADDGALPWPLDIERLREAVSEDLSDADSTAQRGDEKIRDRIPCVINTSAGAVTVEGLSVKLSENELRVLTILCEAEGEAVSRSDIMELLGAETGNASDVYICHLRRKLELPLGMRLIFTERGKGYRTILATAKK